MRFRINVDYPTGRTTIHTVNNDRRCQPREKRPQDGGWLGPFATEREATQAAREAGLRVHPCRVCKPRLSTAQRPALRVEKEPARLEPEVLAVPESSSQRERVRLGRTLGSAAYSVAKEAENRPRMSIQQERILTEAATELTQIWAGLEEGLLAAQSSDFGDEVVRGLKHEATESRISALGTASAYARVADMDTGIYKPVYDIFREMADIQVEVFDTALWACDSRESKDLEYAIVSARYCQSLGEQVLMMMPELAQRRKQGESDQKRGCVWGCVGLFALVILIVAVTAICG